MYRNLTYIALGLLLVACGRYSSQGRLSVVRAADGNLYSTKCLKQGDFGDYDDCQVVAGYQQEDDSRGFWGGGRRRQYDSFLIWDLLGFNRQSVCQYFSNTWSNPSQCYQFFGLNYQYQPQQPRCNANWLGYEYYPQFSYYGCGYSWYYKPYPPTWPPMPQPQPQPQPPVGSFAELLTVEVKSLNSDSYTTYKLSGVPDTNEIQPYKFTKRSCTSGTCGAETLVLRINQEEFASLAQKVEQARYGLIRQIYNDVVCFAAPSKRYTFKGANGVITLGIEEPPCGIIIRNETQAALDLVALLKTKLAPLN